MCSLREAPARTIFPSSLQAAVLWCLAVQECSMLWDWPYSALKYWATERDARASERTSDHGLLFRGPRLKMGVCEGSPASIMPDHLGRADYHGASINQAARFMDAGGWQQQQLCHSRCRHGTNRT